MRHDETQDFLDNITKAFERAGGPRPGMGGPPPGYGGEHCVMSRHLQGWTHHTMFNTYSTSPIRRSTTVWPTTRTTRLPAARSAWSRRTHANDGWSSTVFRSSRSARSSANDDARRSAAYGRFQYWLRCSLLLPFWLTSRTWSTSNGRSNVANESTIWCWTKRACSISCFADSAGIRTNDQPAKSCCTWPPMNFRGGQLSLSTRSPVEAGSDVL